MNAKKLASLYMAKQAAGWGKLPKGWTKESVKKFWKTLTGEVKHKVTKCIKEMEGKIDDPGAFCASCADMVEGSTDWRKGPRKKSASSWSSRASHSVTAEEVFNRLQMLPGIKSVEINDEWKDGYYSFRVNVKPDGALSIRPTARGGYVKAWKISNMKSFLSIIRRSCNSFGIHIDRLEAPARVSEYRDPIARRNREPVLTGYRDTGILLDFYVGDMVKVARPVMLLTQQDRKKLPPLYSQEDVKDPIVWVKFFNPYGSGTWYAMEFDGKDTFFGYVKGLGDDELGYFSLREMSSLRGPGGMQGIERDMYFKPCPLSQAKRK